MMDEVKNVERFYSAERIFRRGGNFLIRIFTKPEKKLMGTECMQLKDTYGFRPEAVYLMAKSHGFEIDYDEFGRLLDEEEKKYKMIKALAV